MKLLKRLFNRWRSNRQDLKIVIFRKLDGSNIPLQPWPQVFYMRRGGDAYYDYEVRPLTFTGWIKGIGMNLISMNYWRFMRIMVIIGFIDVPEACRMSWHFFRWDFWNSVRAKKLRERFRGE